MMMMIAPAGNFFKNSNDKKLSEIKKINERIRNNTEKLHKYYVNTNYILININRSIQITSKIIYMIIKIIFSISN